MERVKLELQPRHNKNASKAAGNLSDLQYYGVEIYMSKLFDRLVRLQPFSGKNRRQLVSCPETLQLLCNVF